MNTLTDAYKEMERAVVPDRLFREDNDLNLITEDERQAHNTCRSHVATALPQEHVKMMEALREWVSDKENAWNANAGFDVKTEMVVSVDDLRTLIDEHIAEVTNNT